MKTWETIVCLLLCVGIAGCALFGMPRPPEKPPAPVPPMVANPAPSDPVAALRAERDQIRSELAALDSKLRAAEREKAIAPLRTLTTWAQWIGGAVALLAVVGGVLLKVGVGLPVGGRLILGVGLSGVALAAAAAGLGSALPWIGPIGLGVLVLAVLAGLGWAAYTWKRGGEAAASEWVRYASALDDDRRRVLDDLSRSLQGRAATIVDKLLPPPTNNPGTR